MKNVVLTILGIMISIYVIGTCLCVFSWETRKNVLDEHVSRVLARTLEDEYQSKDVQRVYEHLVDELTFDVGKNGRIEVEIGQLDLDKGIIHVIVKEHFRQFNGQERTITCEKTVIMDSQVESVYSAGGAAAVFDSQVWLDEGYKASSTGTSTGSSDTYSNAYSYYAVYEGKMIFKPTDETEAGVFYGTKAKQSSNGKIVFRTLGWRVTVKDKDGEIIEQVFYSLNGENIQVADSRVVDNYKYKLYNITLDNLKSRLSDEANNALRKADCSIVFDACITVVKNGVYQGGMTDNGIDWGNVYTTYEGIVSAQNWSAKSKEALKSYFNKDMADMFFEVSLSCGTGIASVSGGGKYCYGTEITIDATPQKGYTFLEWVGGITTTTKKYTFTVNEDVTMKATTTRDDVAVNLYRNQDSKDTQKATVFFAFGEEENRLPDMGWEKEGYYQTGWSTSRIIAQPYFGNQQIIKEDWMEKVAPSVDLYATWEPNSYRIVFDGNGATGTDSYVLADYTESITLLAEGYVFSSGALAGWSMSSEQNGAEYFSGETVTVAELAERAGVVDEDGGIIYLYAQKDTAPRIEGDAIYISLLDAKRGIVTAEWLCRYVYVVDLEDGEISYEDGYGAEKPDGGFGILDFQSYQYLQCTEETCIVERFYARDSIGNETYKQVEVYVVEDAKVELNANAGNIRFLSGKYYKDEQGNWIAEEEGGLTENSIWKWRAEHVAILDEIFLQKIGEETP